MNKLYLNFMTELLWFEFGGQKIGRINFDPSSSEETAKWRLIGKYKYDFPSHFAIVYVDEKNGYFLMGGIGNSCLQYANRNIQQRARMNVEKSFYPVVHLNGILYTFGGYDNYEKLQLKDCQYFDINKNEWFNNEGVGLNEARSQGSACIFDDETIYIFGGYNKEIGTLASIEKYEIKTKKMTVCELKMPTPLRRFTSIKISSTKILLIGGIQRLSKESDAVFCFDLDKDMSIEKLDKIEKAGVIEFPIIVDPIGSLHLFIENSSGTSPPTHITYSFLEYS
jgi:hypothetical protein